MQIQSALLSQIPHLSYGFGSIQSPFPHAATSWQKNSPQWKQNHGTRSVEISLPMQSCGEADAFWTQKRNIPVAVRTADCVPILLAHRQGTSIAAIHAGWRGTHASIILNFWKTLKANQPDLCRPQDWVAVVGPCIGPCCYEVSADLAQTFATQFPLIPPVKNNFLDLAAINIYQLEHIGIEHELIRLCTRCAQSATGTPMLYSHRRGDSKRQLSGLVLT